MDRISQIKTELLIKEWAEMVRECRSNGDASALCFSMIESTKLNKLDVYGYLIYLLSELTKLLPWSKILPEYFKIPKRA